MKLHTRVGYVAAFLLGIAGMAAASGKLAVGMAAPEMKVAKWVKGTPVTKFEKGKVYVVEFWATWCGPCKQSIPHLTELAKKYEGKATFTGISVYEKNAPVGQYANYGEKVDAFVKEWGDKMNYNVAWDGDEASMSHNWMEAAGQNGIPTAFVVDQTGTVVWIGHPMVGLDEAVGQVIAGTFDVKAEAEKQAKAREKQEQQMAAINSYIKPLRAHDYKGAVAGMDKLIASDPKMEFQLGVTRYGALSNYDPAAANEYALKLANGVYRSQAPMLNSPAWMMVDDKGMAKGADYKVAVKIAEKCVALTKDGDPEAAMNMDTLGYCYFKAGVVNKAVKIQEKAVKTADATKDFDKATRKELADHLDLFQQKKS